MTDPAYAIGIDFGTESGRALLLDLTDGTEVAVAVVPYTSGVIDRALPSTGEPLPPDWALQDPDDWIEVINRAVPEVLSRSGIQPGQVVGLGVDFTSCTVLPVDRDGSPLCIQPGWRGRRHAWPKLWKHHAAAPVADRLNDVALERGEEFLRRYGGRISSEWYFPKLIELWLEDREIYDAAAGFIEATDWIVWQLTGHERRQSCTAGYKAFWSPREGLPSNEYFGAAYPGFARPSEKLGSSFSALGTAAGTLRADVAARLGLGADVVCAVGNVDSFVSFPGAGVQDHDAFVTVVGTSTCSMVLSPEEILLPGITGVVKDGILPGLYGYEAGQAAVGDMLAWCVEAFDPAERSYADLEQEAKRIAPGQSGLVALDWFNGNRSILADADLSGALLGLTLRTTRAEIYRALLESIAFGNRRIIENFAEHGLPVSKVIACGGLAQRSPLTMQLIADASGLPVTVPDSGEIPARGSALFGAVAAGHFDSIESAITATRPRVAETYRPDPAAQAVLDRVYAVYRNLYETLGRSQVELLHELKRIRITERSGS